jgi:hypothetical protein
MQRQCAIDLALRLRIDGPIDHPDGAPRNHAQLIDHCLPVTSNVDTQQWRIDALRRY